MTIIGPSRDRSRARFQWTSSWDDLEWKVGEGGTRYATYRIGEADDETAPLVLAVEYPPGRRYETHWHDDDYTEILLEGSLEITRKQHGPGTIRYVQGETAYGPLIAGLEGAKLMVIFRSGVMDARYPNDGSASGGRHEGTR